MDLRRLRTRLSDALFELAVRLAPTAPAPKLEPPRFAATPWDGLEKAFRDGPAQTTLSLGTVETPMGRARITLLKAEPAALTSDRKNDTATTAPAPEPDFTYVADPAKQRVAGTLRMLAHDVEIGVASSFQAVWHGGPCPMHVVAHLPPSAGDA